MVTMQIRNTRLGVDGGLEVERQILVEEQKSCRTLARKHSLETNRRRKALEEKRKQWDFQEERLRENILQQRKERVQDATERFQRAHLPPSQRRRPSFKKSTPNIEEALSHIQGNFSFNARQSSFLSSSSTISRSCTPSPKPPLGPNTSRHQRALSAVEAYTKLMQGRTSHSTKNSQMLFLNELQETQVRERETSSPQDHHVDQIHSSDSLSSLDSLENEDMNHNNTMNIACSSHSLLDQYEVLNSKKTHVAQRHILDRPPISTNTSSSDNPFQQSQAYSSPQTKPWYEEPEEPNKKLQNLPHATRGTSAIEKSLCTEAPPSHHNHSFLALSGIVGTDTEDKQFLEKHPSNKIAEVTQSSPDNTPLEMTCLLHDRKVLDSRQYVTHQEDRNVYSKNPSATKVILPNRNCNHEEIFCEAYEAQQEPAASQETIEKTHQLHKSNDVMNNLDKESDSEPKAVRPWHTEPINQTCNSNTHERSDIPKCHVISGTGLKMSEVRVIKGILKKQSKYVTGDAKTAYGAGHFIFNKQVALSIRDSVELTRMKAKDEDRNKNVKKKLRWFDEVNVDEEKREITQNTMKQYHAKNKSACHSVDHQESVTVATGIPRAGLDTTPLTSTGYHFTKQAWADVGVQTGKLQDQGEEVRVQRGSVRTGCPRVPRRVRSARVGSGSVSSRSRKGTVFRPQSATEVGHIARSQGRIMVPRPPPRTHTTEGTVGETAGYNTRTPHSVDPTNAKQGFLVEQTLYRDNPNCLSPSFTHVIRTDNAICTPFPPPYYPSNDGASRGPAISGQQESQASRGRRGGPMLYDEKGLCLDRTPTDEEISQLWHGVRSALATKEGDPRNILACNGSLSAVPQARANLTQVTINGDSLISGVKAVTRMSGFFLSPSNARNLIRRQNPESGESRRRCVEPSQQASGTGNRRPPLPTQAAFQISTCTPKFYLTQPDEGPQSAAQPHLAGLPGVVLLADTDVEAAMEAVHTQRQHDQQGLATISLEEQKILLSLDRLNYRLQYVQEYAGCNAIAKGGVHEVMPYAGEGKASTHRKHRIISADSRSRSQKRF